MRTARTASILALAVSVPALAGPVDLLSGAGPLPPTVPGDMPAHRARAVNVHFEALPDPASAPGSTLEFNLFDDTVVAGRVEAARLSDRSVIYTGTLIDEPSASFIAVRCENTLVAEVRSPTRGLYEIRPLPTGPHAVLRVNESQFRPCGLGPEHHVGVAGGNDAPHAGPREHTEIAVMVVYTAQARTGAGGQAGIDALIDLAITQANQVYANSQIDLTINLVYRGLVDYTETGDYSTEIGRFRSTTDGYMDEVHPIRDCAKADMVALLVNDFNACGVGYLMQNVSTSFAPSAFTVTDKDCIPNFTFAHELGHNMGCHHDRDNASSGAYPYSYGYRTPDSVYRTVMAYAPGQRVAYFSNPDVTYLGYQMGVPVGQPLQAHNALTITNTKATVAGFRTGFHPADFNGDGFVDGLDSDEFNNAFEAGDTSADFNGDGFVDGLDSDAFNNAFEAGC